LNQQKNTLPTGPYVFAVSVTSPFIKFKNASKETIDGSDELVEEIRRALMQAGQKLSRHIRAEDKAADLERKLQHIEKFGPILVQGLARIVNAPKSREKKAEEGLEKLLGRDTDTAEEALKVAEEKLQVQKKKERKLLGDEEIEEVFEEIGPGEDEGSDTATRGTQKTTTKKSTVKKATTKTAAATKKTTTKKVAGKK
jgi:DNA topoisomerase VI subunit B